MNDERAHHSLLYCSKWWLQPMYSFYNETDIAVLIFLIDEKERHSIKLRGFQAKLLSWQISLCHPLLVIWKTKCILLWKPTFLPSTPLQLTHGRMIFQEITFIHCILIYSKHDLLYTSWPHHTRLEACFAVLTFRNRNIYLKQNPPERKNRISKSRASV